ncbi:unnamed protein product [Polarella glacialis]|uniref:Uncharacterized protein n=1 Tax=Polarella glacialis TaxID=89957 RepID=A0A813LLH1_POLGL|nr:unnamed protein product [Polarella glacialis]
MLCKQLVAQKVNLFNSCLVNPKFGMTRCQLISTLTGCFAVVVCLFVCCLLFAICGLLFVCLLFVCFCLCFLVVLNLHSRKTMQYQEQFTACQTFVFSVRLTFVFSVATGKRTMGALEPLSVLSVPVLANGVTNVFVSSLHSPGKEKLGNKTSLLMRGTT